MLTAKRLADRSGAGLGRTRWPRRVARRGPEKGRHHHQPNSLEALRIEVLVDQGWPELVGGDRAGAHVSADREQVGQTVDRDVGPERVLCDVEQVRDARNEAARVELLAEGQKHLLLTVHAVVVVVLMT